MILGEEAQTTALKIATHSVDFIIEYQGYYEKIMAEVTDLGKNTSILRFPWLKCYNPEINWIKSSV